MTAVASGTTPPVPVKLTPEDLLRLPDEGKSFELVGGALVEKNVSVESSGVAAKIMFLLQLAVATTKIAKVFPMDLGYLCFPDDPEKVRKPDVSVVLSDRLTALGAKDYGYMPIPADLAVEVISPNDNASEVDVKVGEYLKAGFKLIWVVHPRLRCVSIFRTDGAGEILGENDDITGETILPSFKCKVAEFFN